MYKNEETLLTDVLGPRNDVPGSREKAIYLAIHVADLFNSQLDTIMLYDSAIMFLTALFLRVHLDETMPDTLEEVARLVCNPDGREHLDQFFVATALKGPLECCSDYWNSVACVRGNLFDELLLRTSLMFSPMHIKQIRALVCNNNLFPRISV